MKHTQTNFTRRFVAIAGLYLFIGMQIMITQPLQGGLKEIKLSESKYNLGPKLTKLLRDVKMQNKTGVRLSITALGIDESDFEEHLGDLGRDSRRTHALWVVKGVGKTTQGQPLHLVMRVRDGIAGPRVHYRNDEDLKISIEFFIRVNGSGGKRVGFVQNLGKQRPWTTSVNNASIDRIYLGKTEAVVKHVFGKADKTLGEWRAYTGMNITGGQGEKYQTVWFWIAKGVVKEIRCDKVTVKEVPRPKIYQAPNGSTLVCFFEDYNITYYSPGKDPQIDKFYITDSGRFIIAFNYLWKILPDGNLQSMGRSDVSKVSGYLENFRIEKSQIIWKLKR
tara:strand:- start:265 stop:1269 length:1005 start_codon:yes stop_codon:yes gene_type:complete